MSQITGFVRRINTKIGTGKRGPWTLFSLMLEKDDGTESGWISAGFDKPPFAEGSYITIDTVQTDRGTDYVKGSYKHASPPTAPPAAKGIATGVGPKAPSASSGHVDRNDSIVYQSSRKDALALVALLLEHDALPVSASTAKAGQAKRFEEIKAFTDKLTVQFYGDVQSGRVLQQVVDAGADTASAADSGASTATSQEDND